MEEKELPIWELNDYKDGLSITVQNIYCNDMNGTDDSFGTSVDYKAFASEFFDSCYSYEEMLETFIYEFKREIGRSIPYIVHPIEVWQILRNNDCSVEVQIAGLLHDTLEDTDTTPQEIQELFGDRILHLVMSESEDKSKTWKERKQHTIDALVNESKATLQVCCADKLSRFKIFFKVTSIPHAPERTTRKPMLLRQLYGVMLLRVETAHWAIKVPQLPPRITRFVPESTPIGSIPPSNVVS